MWIFNAIANAVGKNFIGTPNYLFGLLFNRVKADGGVTEAQQCTIEELTDLQNDNLLSSASLIVTPNGYKEGKLYSVIPSDGSGDMSVVRATTATRVNSAGLVELVPYNLLQYSEQFDNSYWFKANGSSVTSNSTIAPNGTLTADTLNVSTTAYSTIYNQNLFGFVNGVYTQTIYAKKSTKNWLYILDLAGSGAKAWFNLDTGVVGTVAIGYTASMESVGNGWYRCLLSQNSNPALYYQFGASDADNSFTPSSSGSIYIWGAQLVEGTSALDYQRTETRLNIPRLDYSNGSCPSLLVEPQRTNLITYSSSFDNAAWVKTNVTATINTTNSPSGVQDGNSILEVATTGAHQSWNRVSMSSGQSYTQSCFFKANGRNRVIMQIFDNATQYTNAIFDLSTGVVVASSGIAKIESFENGWYRCTITGTSPATGLGYCVIGLCEDTYNVPSVMPTYAGNASKGIFAWGAQLEAGTYPTSYIPTTSVSVTRNKDLGNNDVFASTYTLDADFCLFQDFECFDFNNFPVFWSGGNYSTGSDYRSYMLANSTTALNLFGVNEVLTGQLTAFTFSANTRYKLAVRRVGSTISWFINGVKYLNAGGTTTTTIKIRSISGSSLGGQNVMRLNTAVIFEDATLTDAQCIQLTTI